MGERHRFKIPIGDWSGDGHGKCDYFEATAAKPVEAVREAYFAAKTKLPKCCPEEFCEAYGDSSISTETRALLREAGAPIPSDETMDNDYGFSPANMAAVVVWFLNQGDAELAVQLEPVESVPSLAFYGMDAKNRHIGFIGYGLQGS